MIRYGLLAIDVDGTLVNSRDELTPATRDALVRAGEAGVHIVLATGRRYSKTLHLVEPLGIEVPLVTATGALVKDPKGHRTFYRAEFAPGILETILRTVAAAGYDPVLYGDTFSDGFDFFLSRLDTPNPELCEYLRNNGVYGRVCPGLVAAPPEGIFAGFAMGTREAMLALEAQLHAAVGDGVSTHVLRSPKYAGFFCEFAPGGVTKWSGIRRLADQWNIGVAEICAVGDDVNDIQMIRSAGLGIAMGNALPEVKAAADRIAPTHDENGLVRVVQWLLDGE